MVCFIFRMCKLIPIVYLCNNLVLILWMLILAVEDILEAFNRWKFREPLPADAHKKVSYVKLTHASIHKQDWTHRQELNVGWAISPLAVSMRLLSWYGVVLIVWSLIGVLMVQVKLMCSYCKKHDETEVPDPYYGGPQGFEKVM